MYTDKIPAHTLKLLGVLKNLLPEGTYLAGGTGLCLHLNHRPSYDLDLYVPHEFTELQQIQRFEQGIPDFELVSQDWQTIVGKSQDTELSLFYYKYSLLEDFEWFDELAVASIADIAAMKLEAISSRGLKRDFFDLYTICQKKQFSLLQVVESALQKYNRADSYTPHYLKSLVYFYEAETKHERAQIIDSEWEKVKSFFMHETPLLTRKLIQG